VGNLQLILRSLKWIAKKSFQVIRRGLSFNGRSQKFIKVNGHKMFIPDDLAWAYSSGYYYEENVTYFLDILVKSFPDPVLFDVGANCGYYSIRYSDFCKQIFSFEPVANTYRILKKNIRRNSITNTKLFKLGLSDSNGERIINLYNSSGNNSLFERNIPKDHSLKKIGTETIKLKSLDELLISGKVAIPNIIKVDVEGSELNFLKGAKETITKYRPIILLEYSENTSADAGYSREQLIDTSEFKDYNIYGIPEDEKDFTLVNRDNFGDCTIANLIFLPTETDPFKTLTY
jgi:FkbM family methyltransferase